MNESEVIDARNEAIEQMAVVIIEETYDMSREEAVSFVNTRGSLWRRARNAAEAAMDIVDGGRG